MKSLPGQVTEIERLAQAGNYLDAAQAAHSIKSGARQIGAISLGNAAAQVEALCNRSASGYTDHDFQSYLNLLTDLTPPTIHALNQQ